MLPLARKCSIVSEEGSCMGASDYSGNEYSSDINSRPDSVSNYNSLNDYPLNAELKQVRSHSHLGNNNQSSNNSSKKNSRESLKLQSLPLVKIEITDYSNTIEEDERLEIDEFYNCTLKKEERKDDVDEEDRKLDSSNYFCPTLNSLHQASSSPDLGREEKVNEANSNLIGLQDEDLNDNALDEHVMNQLNQSTNSKTALHTSMRIIMQSKSCNNILCSGLNRKDDHCSNCEMNRQNCKQKEEETNSLNDRHNQLDVSTTPSKEDQLSTKSNKSTNLNIFSRIIGKKLNSNEKEDTKRLSLNLDNCNTSGDKNHQATNKFTLRKCKKDKNISCCAIN